MKEINVSTSARSEFKDITAEVSKVVSESGISKGVCKVFVPHTTAAVTVNENADPSVTADIEKYLEKTVPWSQPYYRHSEGNSAAHIKSSLLGSSVEIPLAGSSLRLGTWQAIYFCEFDGPRTRKVWIKVMEG